MIILHHLNNSRSQRILWLLEELEVPYEIKYYERDKKTMLAPPELKKVHPLGKSPVITDGDHTIAESGAIIEYLIEHYDIGKFRPTDKEEKIRYSYWMHYAEGSAMLPLILTLIFDKIESTPMPFFARPIVKTVSMTIKKMFINKELDSHFNFMENELKKTTWFAGKKFSGADIQMSFPLQAGDSRNLLDGRPHLKKLLETIHARPAYKKALERGGDYTLY